MVDGGVTFYAGYVLRAHNACGPDGRGLPIGMLCLLDSVPNSQSLPTSLWLFRVRLLLHFHQLKIHRLRLFLPLIRIVGDQQGTGARVFEQCDVPS